MGINKKWQLVLGFDTVAELEAARKLLSNAEKMLSLLKEFSQLVNEYDCSPEDEILEFWSKVNEVIKKATE